MMLILINMCNILTVIMQSVGSSDIFSGIDGTLPSSTSGMFSIAGEDGSAIDVCSGEDG